MPCVGYIGHKILHHGSGSGLRALVARKIQCFSQLACLMIRPLGDRFLLKSVPRDSCKLKSQMANAEWRLELKRGMDGALEAEPQRKSSEPVPRC